MSISLKIYRELDLAIFICTEDVTGAQAEKALAEFIKAGITKDTLWDERRANIELSTLDTRNISPKVIAHMDNRAGGRTAVVAPRDFTFGMARLAKSLFEEGRVETMIFREMEPALEWLGVSRQDVELEP